MNMLIATNLWDRIWHYSYASSIETLWATDCAEREQEISQEKFLGHKTVESGVIACKWST